MKNGKGASALLSLGLVGTWVFMLWQAQGTNVATLEKSQSKSVATLERLTNQRLEGMERIIYAPVDREDNPIRHTEAIKTLLVEVERNNTRSEERRQEMLAALREHEELNGHPEAQSRLVAQEEKLVEVETQFRHLDRFVQLLWQRVYNEPLPNPPEK